MRCFCRALLILDCQIKARGRLTNLSKFHTCRKNSLRHFAMAVYVRLAENCDRRVHKKKASCSCWQACERSGAKPTAVKSLVGVHARHDGSEGAAAPLCSADLLDPEEERSGGEGSAGWSQTPLLCFSHTRVEQTRRRGSRPPASLRHSVQDYSGTLFSNNSTIIYWLLLTFIEKKVKQLFLDALKFTQFRFFSF